MFDFDVSKLLVFGIIALVVIPPKDLPRVMRTIGQYVGKMRRMAADFQGQFREAIREADLEGVKKEIDSIGAAAKIDSTFDPVMAMRTEMTHAIEPPKGGEGTVTEIAPPPPPAADEKTPPAPADAEKAAAS
jgi:sec-independent protein translocase protein TatB